MRHHATWKGRILCCPQVAPKFRLGCIYRGVVGRGKPGERMSNRTLTDRFIQSCKPAPAGKRIDYADAVVPGLVLRVTDRGHKSFALRCRYPSHPDNPTRRALGDYGALSLDDARQKARRWIELIGKGIDPKIDEARQKAEAQRRQVNTFAAVADDYLERHAAKLARSQQVERIINSEFVKRWGARPV